jgi:hypothetical protein
MVDCREKGKRRLVMPPPFFGLRVVVSAYQRPILIGDPGRAYLPRPRLRLLAEYRVSDFGEVKGAAMKPSAVFSLEPVVTTVLE